MAEHDPADVKYMARLICASVGNDPDALMYPKERDSEPVWHNYKHNAIRALDWMQANGVKMTTRTNWDVRYSNPLTPRDKP